MMSPFISLKVNPTQPNQNRTFFVDVGEHTSTVNPRYQVSDEIDGHAYYTYGYDGSLFLLESSNVVWLYRFNTK